MATRDPWLENFGQPDPGFWSKTSCLQLGYGIWVNLTLIGAGLVFGFPAISIPQLKDPRSSIKLTYNDEAWIASVMQLMIPFGKIASGIMMDRYGRRITLMLSGVPFVISWVCIGAATNANAIIVGLAIAGVGFGMTITTPRVYITEFTLPNMREVIGTLPNLAMSMGMFIQAGLGSLLKWNDISYLGGVYSFVIVALNYFLPESPYFVLLKGSPEETKQALSRFRSEHFDLDTEMKDLMDFKNDNSLRSLTFREKFYAMFKPSACKPFCIVTFYIIFMQLSGVHVVVMWAVEMLEMSNCSVNANMGNFLMGLTRLVLGLVTSIMLYYVGMRFMAITSALGVGVASITLGVWLQSDKERSPLPLYMYLLYSGFATIGYYALPFLLFYEMVPLQIRGFLGGIQFSLVDLLAFGLNQLYPIYRDRYGIAKVFCIFGGFSIAGTLFLFFKLPETKGLTLQEIEEYFKSVRPTLVSQREVVTQQRKQASLRSGKFVSGGTTASKGLRTL